MDKWPNNSQLHPDNSCPAHKSGYYTCSYCRLSEQRLVSAGRRQVLVLTSSHKMAAPSTCVATMQLSAVLYMVCVVVKRGDLWWLTSSLISGEYIYTLLINQGSHIWPDRDKGFWPIFLHWTWPALSFSWYVSDDRHLFLLFFVSKQFYSISACWTHNTKTTFFSL